MRFPSLFPVLGLCFCGAAIISLQPLQAQQKYVIWDGAYTAAQAERGKEAYGKHCSGCHGTDAKGGKATPLTGDLFMMHWEAKTVEQLFHKVRDTMPRGTPAATQSVSENDKLDIIAYVIQQNGFPAGAQELTDEPRLATVQIMPVDGPSAPRNGSMVESTGCLEDRDNQWALTNSTEPKTTSVEASPSSNQQTGTDAAARAGNLSVPLVSVFPSPKGHAGHKMRAKGLLMKTATGDRINVISLEMIAETCP